MLPCSEACLCRGLMDVDKCFTPLPEGKVGTQRGEDWAACLSAGLLAFGAVCSVTVRLSRSTPVPPRRLTRPCRYFAATTERTLCGRLPRGRPP